MSFRAPSRPDPHSQMATDVSELKIAVDEPRSWARRLTITVPAERVTRERQTVAKRVAGRINLPGFRKGKAPSSVIEKKYGAAIEQEALEHVVQHAYREAIQDRGFQPISEASVGQMDYSPGSDLTFQVEFEVRPEIELSRLGGFTVEAPSPDVPDDEVDKVLDRLREEHADWQALDDGSPRAGDRVSVEITPVREASAAAEPDQPEARPYEFVLGKDQAIPDVEAAIQTLRPGTDAEFEIEVPAGDDGDAGVEHQKVRIRLLRAERPALPELDDAFAATVDANTPDLGALREPVRAPDLRLALAPLASAASLGVRPLPARCTIHRILERRGYNVLTAGDGGEAIELVEGDDQPIHLLLTDVIMPGLNGQDVALRVRALRPDIRVLFMSGYNEEAVLRHGVLAAGTAFLEKPFSPSVLLDRVRSILSE